MILPALDLILHNLVALGVMVVVVMLLAQLVVTVVLRASNRFLQLSTFTELTPEDHSTFRQRVRRGTLIVVAIISAALLAGAVTATFFRRRALDLAKGALEPLAGQDLAPLGARALNAGGILLGALFVDIFARAILGILGSGLERSKSFAPRRESLSEIIGRIRTGLRALILSGAAILIVRALGLSEGTQRAVDLLSYLLIAFYASRVIVRVAYLAVDLLFDSSGRLARLESPLKYLGSLTHLGGITKRTVDYFVYVGAATWVAEKFSPDTWLARAGRVGIRVIAIFYLSRVMVEICILFVNEIFLGKTTEKSESEIQQRRTLVPVAVGILRYGIYFSALIMVLREMDIDTTPLLAGAGVLGVAVGLGAQAFVGDIVAGFFILFENLLLVGDLVEVSGVRGKVEEIGVRITKIRDDAGVLHAIPNGEVRKVSSHSKAYVNAVVDLYVPYEEDPRRVRATLTEVAEEVLQAETGAREGVEVKVQELSEGSVLFRVSAKVSPGKDEDIGDVLRARLLEALRDAGIGAPRPRRAVLVDDGGLRIAPPIEAGSGQGDEPTKPPEPFKPPDAD